MKITKYNSAYLVISAVFCTMLWGTAFPAIKIGYELFRIEADDIPTKLIFAGARFLLAGIIVLSAGAVSGKNKTKILLNKNDLIPVGILALFQTFLQYLLLYIGLTSISGTRSSILTSVSAFGSVILSAVFWKSDRLTAFKITGCLVGISGIVLMNIRPGSLEGFTLLGDGIVILSNLSGAAGNVISKKISSGRHPAQISGWQLTIGGTALILTGFLTGGRLTFYDINCLWILLYLAAMAGTAFLLWTKLLFIYPVSKVGVFNMLIPVFGTLWSGIFLGEDIFTMGNIASLLLVCSGIFLVNYHKKEK